VCLDETGLQLLRDTRSGSLETFAYIVLKGQKHAEDRGDGSLLARRHICGRRPEECKPILHGLDRRPVVFTERKVRGTGMPCDVSTDGILVYRQSSPLYSMISIMCLL
jgi:hypothetical protein